MTGLSRRPSLRWGLFWLGLSVSSQCHAEKLSPPLTCSAPDEEELDPALQEMKFDLGLGDGEETFLAYVQPDVTSFYQDQDVPISTDISPQYKGLAGKFINMSPRKTLLYWDAGDGSEPALLAYIGPFRNEGTATYPGHKWFLSDEDDPTTPLIRWVVRGAPENVFVYDPYLVPGDPDKTNQNLSTLTPDQLELYLTLRRTVLFNEEYIKVTGQPYLATYPRPRPSHKMWRADYFGQEHWVTTRETHFVALPPKEELGEITTFGKQRVLHDEDPRLLEKYRAAEDPLFNMTLKVLSCAPRVFEIQNFLSKVEVDHIIQLALDEELHRSTLGNRDDHAAEDVSEVRTSLNSWLSRERSPILDAIHRRAADLLRIDEALFRWRDADEYPELGTRLSIAEQLQLVHYGVGQKYDSHPDFGFPYAEASRQNERFATVLFYLNEMDGGTTSFPLWVNGETSGPLDAVPETGKAVLFYDQLPDGNLDARSMHSANAVVEGEKWLINLWVWEPVYEEETEMV